MTDVTSLYDPFSPVQLIGYVAFALGVSAVLQKDDVRMKILMVSMTGFIVTHFIWLGAYAAAAGCLIAGTRTGLSIFEPVRARAKYFAAVFMGATLVFGLMTYARPLDAMPIIAVLAGHYAFFNLRGLKLRMALLGISSMWLTHNILAYSYGPAMMEGLIILANLTTIRRLKIHQKNQAALPA